MKIIVVDDDPIAIEEFKDESAEISEVELIGVFQSSLEVIHFIQNTAVDVAFLDIDMPQMNGLELMEVLRAACPSIIIMFITAHTGYTIEAIRRKCDYIIFKPYNHEDLVDAVERGKALATHSTGHKKVVECRTFGRFDLFVDHKVVLFRSQKAKELLAYCVFREGGTASTEEIIDNLWPGFEGTVSECSVFRTAVKDLKSTLEKNGVDQLFGRERGKCFIRPEMIECDLYKFLQNDPEAMSDYQGRFMEDYAWGNYKIYLLNEKKELYKNKSEKEYIHLERSHYEESVYAANT